LGSLGQVFEGPSALFAEGADGVSADGDRVHASHVACCCLSMSTLCRHEVGKSPNFDDANVAWGTVVSAMLAPADEGWRVASRHFTPRRDPVARGCQLSMTSEAPGRTPG